MSNVKDFPIHCNVCNEEIEDGMIFFKHPKHGFVCENCPEFNYGAVKVLKNENPNRET